MSDNVTWEYHIFVAWRENADDVSEKLNGFGKHGWELVSVYRDDATPTKFVLKRPVPVNLSESS